MPDLLHLLDASISTAGFFQLLNGVWSIVVAWLLVFMVLHLREAAVLHRVSGRRWLLELPPGMRLAVFFLEASFGLEVTRVTVWWWRFQTAGAGEFTLGMYFWMILGAAVATHGFLGVLREASRPRYGLWPTVAAVASAVVYIAAGFYFEHFDL